MNTFVIIYELSDPALEVLYTSLFSQIKSFEYWARPLRNIWLIKTITTKEEVMSRLRSTLRYGDKILIMSVNKEWISFNIDPVVVKWMQMEL